MKKIFVTGAKGFIGQTVCSFFAKSNYSVMGAVRTLDSLPIHDKIRYVAVGDIETQTNWKDMLLGQDCIIHCAGKVHVMKKNIQPESYFAINVDGIKFLAQQAAEAGVKRLIFLSSIKVNGENTGNFSRSNKKNKIIQAFTEKDIPNPKGPYAISKFKAEKIISDISDRTGLEVVILRLPIVYGYGAKGNLLRLMKLIRSGIPLPFGNLNNKRSMIGMDNLLDLIFKCVEHPNASGKTFLVSDGKSISTTELLYYIASAMECPLRLFSFPTSILNLFSQILGKKNIIDRLVGSLQVDSSYTKKILNWTPPLSVEKGIKRMVKGE